MVDAKTLVNTLGKQGFIDFVTKSPKNGQTEFERKYCGIKGRVRWRTCGKCGKWVISNYISTPCKCAKVRQSKAPDYRPNFNVGLGYWVESRSEEKRVAKSLGLVESA